MNPFAAGRSVPRPRELRPRGRGFPLAQLRVIVLFALSLAVLAIPTIASTWGVSEPDLRRDIFTLASDRMEGRMSGERGQRLAADYLAKRFADMGLQAETSQGYLQPFPLPPARRVGKASRLVWNGKELRVPEEAAPAGRSGIGSVTGDVVFGGQGRSLGDEAADKAAKARLASHIVVIVSGGPQPASGGPPAGRMGAGGRIAWAQQSGASAVVYVRRAAESAGDTVLPLDGGRTPEGAVPVFGMTRAAALQVLPETYKQVLEGADDPASHVGETLGKAELLAEVLSEPREAANVVGEVPGSDPRLRWECVVVGGHYDHIGFGTVGARDPEKGSVIHHGADDNASGAAGVAAIARAFEASAEHPRRSVVFVCFAGEELGLFGSRYYVEHPVIPMAKTAAMVNLDMVGRLRNNSATVFSTDTSPVFAPAVERLAGTYGLTVSIGGSAPSGSDHASFVSAGVPSLFFFTGLHAEYHTAMDTANLINVPGEAKLLDLVSALVMEIANADAKPEFKAPPPPRQRGGEMAGTRVYLGTVPDFGATGEKGYKIASVVPDGPAARGGLQGGDLIVKFAGTEIADIEGFMAALTKCKPGDKVEVEVRRGSETVRLTVTLGERGAS